METAKERVIRCQRLRDMLSYLAEDQRLGEWFVQNWRPKVMHPDDLQPEGGINGHSGPSQ